MQVTLYGKSHEITKKGIESVSSEPPDRIQRYYVEIQGQRFPIKQAVCAALKIPPAGINTQHAYRWLTKLGYEIHDSGRN